MTTDTQKRPWLAAALAVVYPGLGHVYARSWMRAALWFLAMGLTAILLIPNEVFSAVTAVGDVPAAVQSLPTEATIAIAGVALLSAFDAYLTTKRANARIVGFHCPHCGRKSDPELAFCHWCTVEFRDPATLEES